MPRLMYQWWSRTLRAEIGERWTTPPGSRSSSSSSSGCLWLRRSGGATRNPERQLRRICFGNDAQVERLIDFEMTRTPGISRAEAASRAVDRYRRDNG